jgi:phage recombination protein Bet
MTQEKGLVEYESRGQEVVLTAEIVREFLVTGKKELVTTQEIAYFLGICKARGLNPFLKDVYIIKYGAEPAAIVTSIDFYRSRARSAPDCVGWQKGVICLNKETGELRYSKGLVLPTEELVGGWFKARPTGWTVDFELEVNLAGYIKYTADGKITKFWKPHNQPSQIGKVVESQGLRTVWPDLFQGTYTADERNFDLEEIDAGGPPPAGSAGDITPKPEGPKLDTSIFDKAIKKLKWDKETLSRLEKWLVGTAEGNTSNERTVTADMMKVACGKKFDEFLVKFKEWQDLNYPAPPQDPHPDQLKGAPQDERVAATGEGEGQDSGEPQETKDGSPAKSFSDRQQAAWDRVIKEPIPLAYLKKECGISLRNEMTPENIDVVEEALKNYEPSKKGKK